ncbi:MAG: PKD domain-containing protein [Prolixibacteraceae bacterium]|nr:PKD domain-containing protein [Prolixibacteraceae bacterium]
MAEKLSKITTQYHTFEDNQVLTKDQLNEFIDYFEDQDRMSRIFLSGVGIVCGFNLKLVSAGNKIITITQGAGVTTDGDLIKLYTDDVEKISKLIDFDKIEFDHHKTFEDKFAGYPFFKRKQIVDGKLVDVPIDLIEILPKETGSLNTLNSIPDLEKMVVLLYLESYAKPQDLCTAIDCDNQGTKQIARLRVLLVSEIDAKYIAGLDSVFTKHNNLDDYFNLPEVAVRRIVLNEQNSANYYELKRSYYQALNNADDELLKNLYTGIAKITSSYNSLLQLNLNKNDLFFLKIKLQNILKFSAYSVPFNIQYRYDNIKDIIDTYNEIKTLLLWLKEECCPDIKAFPKHLMLGQLNEIQNDVKHYRHSFYKSPILNCGTNKIEQCRTLVFRLFEIVNKFKTTIGETKITPSNKLPKLSLLSIPFYYEIGSNLLESWDFSKTKNGKQDTNLCYNSAKLSPALPIQNPLNYNLDKFDFYRIEGHQGKDYKTVLEEIDTLKTNHGLAFDIKALSININKENLNIDDYECEFEDLNVLLKAWTSEQDCVLAEVAGFFSSFSTKQPGANAKEAELEIKREKTLTKETDIIQPTGEIPTREFLLSKPIARSANIGSNESVEKIFALQESIQPVTIKLSKVISENLNTSEETLGFEMKMAIEENKGGSVNDIIASTNNKLSEKLNTDLWKAQPEIKAFVIDKSVELMAHSHLLTQRMPDNLASVSTTKVDTYKLSLSQLCTLVKKMKAQYQTVQLSVGLSAFMGILINQLSTVCCSGKKLEILLDEINKRKEKILLSLQLSKFVKKHPGLEHKAGVPVGGTFVLVFLNKENTDELKANIVAEKAAEKLTSTRDILSATSNRGFLISNNIIAKENTTTLRTSLTSQPLISAEKLSILERVIQPIDLPNNTVVADFSLPYMCCSDCAPVNFIVQKTPVTLHLEKDKYCLDKDPEPVLFELTPEDGEIKAEPNVAGMTIGTNLITFDPTVFPDDLLGEPIHFTVNNQITQAEITVYRAVIFDFTVPEPPTALTKITFVPSGNLDGALFLWLFGDGGSSIERNPTYKYNLPVNDENKVTVSLTVTAPNRICQTTVEHDITFKVEETKISLNEDTYCSNSDESFPFKITPQGAEAKIEGSGVETDENGVVLFVPAKAGPGTFTFTLNGEPSGVTVTVREAPVADFVASQKDNKLVLTNTSTGSVSYLWTIDGFKFEQKDELPFTRDLEPGEPHIWKIKLEAFSEFCGSDSTKVIPFETTFIEEPPIDNCVEETKAALVIDQRNLAKLDIQDFDIIHSIWQQTSLLYNLVLKDVDNFLAGKNNNNLSAMFEKLLQTTANFVVEMVDNKIVHKRLLELFSLQLQLFYNILGCQSSAVIKETAGFIQPVLTLILDLLRFLRNNEIPMPNELQEFIKNYSAKIDEIRLLLVHLKTIKDENLI